MPKEATLEQVPLTKRGLIEYLGRQIEPVTAKAASIDLDSRASTVTEMLERCVAQGLVERRADQRPREYKLSDEGRRQLFRPMLGDPSESAPEPDPAGLLRTQEISAFLTRLIDDAIEAAIQKRNEQQGSSDGEQAAPGRNRRMKALLEKANRLADPQETEIITEQHRCVRELLSVERGSQLPREEFQKVRDSLRKQIGDEVTCEKVSRLATLEAELCGEKKGWWAWNATAERKLEAEISGLKRELGLEASEPVPESDGEEE